MSEHVEAAAQAAHDEQDLRAQQRAADSALFAAIFAGLTLLVSILGVVYVKRTLEATLDAVEDTGRATNEMVKANKLAEDSSERQLRAYVNFNNASLRKFANGEPTEVIVWAENQGQTPALNLRFHANFTYFERAKLLAEGWPNQSVYNKTIAEHDVGPGQKSLKLLFGEMASDELRARAEAGEIVGVLFCHATYDDVFGRPHETVARYFHAGSSLKMNIASFNTATGESRMI